jgi:hypothetical protein
MIDAEEITEPVPVSVNGYAAASEELSAQAEDLKRSVAAFKLKGGKMSSLSANTYLGSAPGPKKQHQVFFDSHKSKISLDNGGFGKY